MYWAYLFLVAIFKYVIKSDDRKNGIKELLKYFDIESLSGKKVAIKANYNTQDPFPASTHIDTLGTLVDALKEKGASLVLVERSGSGDTRKALNETGVLELANKKGLTGKMVFYFQRSLGMQMQ